jgi:hypothetical protein
MLCAGVGKVSTQATTGDDEAYDSDEYDESSVNKVVQGVQEDAEDWGEFEDKVDEWGTTASEALTAKKKAQRLAASEGRIYTVQVCTSAIIHSSTYAGNLPICHVSSSCSCRFHPGSCMNYQFFHSC